MRSISASFARSIPIARLLAPLVTAISSSSFRGNAVESRICVAWITNTIRNVRTVVPVFTTSCQVSEKWKSGPVANHTSTATTATIVAIDVPLIGATTSVNRTKVLERSCACSVDMRQGVARDA